MKPVVLILRFCAVCQWLADVASHIKSLSPPFAFSVSISLLQKPEERESYLTRKFFFLHTVRAGETWALPKTMEKILTDFEVSSFHRICNFVIFAMFVQSYTVAPGSTETETSLVLLMDNAGKKPPSPKRVKVALKIN